MKMEADLTRLTYILGIPGLLETFNVRLIGSIDPYQRPTQLAQPAATKLLRFAPFQEESYTREDISCSFMLMGMFFFTMVT